MNLINAIKLLAANVDYQLLDGDLDDQARDAIEEASLVIQSAFDFDTNKVKVDILNGKIKKYRKPAREVNVKMRGI